MLISECDTKKMSYKKVIKYLKNDELKNLTYFSEIQPSLNDSSNICNFYFHNGTYTVNANVDSIWQICITTSPSQLWKGKMLGLSCVYNINTNRMFYHSDQHFDTLETNQIYFINLRINRFFNVAAALIVTNVDYVKKQIEFTYIKGNKSIGKQIVSLIGTDKNKTKIIHDTYYKSNSKFRDKRFYARFHQIAITDLHKRIDEYSMK